MKRAQDGSDVTGFGSFDNSTSESSGSVGGGLFVTLVGCGRGNYSSQVWIEQWRWQW